MKRFFLLLAAWCCLGLSAALAYNPYAPNQFDAVDRMRALQWRIWILTP